MFLHLHESKESLAMGADPQTRAEGHVGPNIEGQSRGVSTPNNTQQSRETSDGGGDADLQAPAGFPEGKPYLRKGGCFLGLEKAFLETILGVHNSQ